MSKLLSNEDFFNRTEKNYLALKNENLPLNKITEIVTEYADKIKEAAHNDRFLNRDGKAFEDSVTELKTTIENWLSTLNEHSGIPLK